MPRKTTGEKSGTGKRGSSGGAAKAKRSGRVGSKKKREQTRGPEDGPTRRAAARPPTFKYPSSHSQTSHAPSTGTPHVRQTVAIVGAGRLGTALAQALAASGGYEVVAMVAAHATSAARAAAIIKPDVRSPAPRAFSAAQLSSLPEAELLFITTPDDAIAATAEMLATVSPAISPTASASRRQRRRRTALHASGALSSDVLAPLAARGFSVGSMHPLVSVSDAASGVERLRTAFYCVEGDRRGVAVARRVVRALGGESFSIKARDKSLYHAAAVMTSGHTVALFDLSARLLARCGLSQREARRVLLPLLSSTLDNLSLQTPARALTGTFARADVSTARKHLAVLEGLEEGSERAALAVYALLGEHSLSMAAGRGGDGVAVKEIEREMRKVLEKARGRL